MLDTSVTINAETVDEAIAQGLAQLGITEDQAEIRIINEGKKGFLGFGRQDAVVVVNRKLKQSLSELTNALELEEKVAKEAILDQEEKATTKEDNYVTEKQEEAKTSSNIENKSKIKEVSKETNFESFDDDDLDIEEEEEDQEYDESSSKEENHHIELHKASHIVANFLIDIIQEYGAEADIEVDQEGNHLIFNIDTDKSGLIIGKHGKIINSLQVLAQTLLHHHYRHRANVTLNVGDYRNRRANILKQMAERTADEVLKTKQPVILESLPAYERKQIHAHLSKIEHISTHSEGKDPNRYLVVEYVND